MWRDGRSPRWRHSFAWSRAVSAHVVHPRALSRVTRTTSSHAVVKPPGGLFRVRPCPCWYGRTVRLLPCSRQRRLATAPMDVDNQAHSGHHAGSFCGTATVIRARNVALSLSHPVCRELQKQGSLVKSSGTTQKREAEFQHHMMEFFLRPGTPAEVRLRRAIVYLLTLGWMSVGSCQSHGRADTHHLCAGSSAGRPVRHAMCVLCCHQAHRLHLRGFVPRTAPL